MLVLDRRDVETLLDIDLLIDALAAAMADLSAGRASLPDRTAAVVAERTSRSESRSGRGRRGAGARRRTRARRGTRAGAVGDSCWMRRELLVSRRPAAHGFESCGDFGDQAPVGQQDVSVPWEFGQHLGRGI